MSGYYFSILQFIGFIVVVAARFLKMVAASCTTSRGRLILAALLFTFRENSRRLKIHRQLTT
jgi:hypothetical protein